MRRSGIFAAGVALALAAGAAPALAAGWVGAEVPRPAASARPDTMTMPAAPAHGHGQSFHKPDIYELTAEVAHWVAHQDGHRHHVVVRENHAEPHGHDVQILEVGAHRIPVVRNHHVSTWHHRAPGAIHRHPRAGGMMKVMSLGY